MKTCIQQGILLTEQDSFQGDVLFEDGKITAIGRGLSTYADEIVQAKGKYVFAGGVDEHTHFGSFHSYSYETAKAAVMGGTTTIVDFVDQKQGQSLFQALESQRAKAKQFPYVHVAFHSMLMDMRMEVLDEIVKLPSYGVSTLKLFTAYRGTPYYADDTHILKVMERVKESGVTLMVHAENADMIAIATERLLNENKIDPFYHTLARDCDSEAEAVQRLITYADWIKIPIFFVHISSKKALRHIINAKRRGQPVYCETCTHYLTLDDTCLKRDGLQGCRYICSPPLRTKGNQEALWEGIRNGTVEAVSSDHCALIGGNAYKMNDYQDFSKVANGAPGVQFRLQMLWSEGVCKQRITTQDFVRIFSARPAEICHLRGKGKLACGYDADIVVYDGKGTKVLKDEDSLEGTDYNTFEGMEVSGHVEHVYLDGKLAVKNGVYVGEGTGRILSAKPFGFCYQ